MHGVSVLVFSGDQDLCLLQDEEGQGGSKEEDGYFKKLYLRNVCHAIICDGVHPVFLGSRDLIVVVLGLSSSNLHSMKILKGGFSQRWGQLI